MAERFGGGAARTGHQHTGTASHQARRGSGEAKGARRAQKRAHGEVREERQGSRKPRAGACTGIPGLRCSAPACSRPKASTAAGAARSGAKGHGGRSGAGEYEKSHAPALVFCSRGPTPAETTSNGGSELRRAPRPPSPGKEMVREFCRARCPAAACPGATRSRRARGERRRRSGTARLPQPPLQHPPPAPAPGLTVLVVLEVVVGTGPAAALGRVLHVVELQKVRPLAREAQEGGGQAPRQGHQPPGAGESRERAEEAAGRALAPPTPPATGEQGSRSRRCPVGPRCPARGGAMRYQRLRAVRGPSSAAPERGAPRPPLVARRRRARLAPSCRRPPDKCSRGQEAEALSATRDRAAGRAAAERRGAERGGQGRKAGAVPAPLLSRLPASSPGSFPGCRKDPRSGRAEEPSSPSPTYPAGRRLSGRPSASRPRPLRSAPPVEPSAAAAREVRAAEGSEDLADTRALPVGTRGRLGSARQAALFLLLFFV